MCNRGMRTRHWKSMSDIAGFDLTPDSGTTLRKMLKLSLEEYMEQFEGISAAASKVKSTVYTCEPKFIQKYPSSRDLQLMKEFIEKSQFQVNIVTVRNV